MCCIKKLNNRKQEYEDRLKDDLSQYNSEIMAYMTSRSLNPEFFEDIIKFAKERFSKRIEQESDKYQSSIDAIKSDMDDWMEKYGNKGLFEELNMIQDFRRMMDSELKKLKKLRKDVEEQKSSLQKEKIRFQQKRLNDFRLSSLNTKDEDSGTGHSSIFEYSLETDPQDLRIKKKKYRIGKKAKPGKSFLCSPNILMSSPSGISLSMDETENDSSREEKNLMPPPLTPYMKRGFSFNSPPGSYTLSSPIPSKSPSPLKWGVKGISIKEYYFDKTGISNEVDEYLLRGWAKTENLLDALVAQETKGVDPFDIFGEIVLEGDEFEDMFSFANEEENKVTELEY